MKSLSVLLLDSFQIRKIISHYKLMSNIFLKLFWSTPHRITTVSKNFGGGGGI